MTSLGIQSRRQAPESDVARLLCDSVNAVSAGPRRYVERNSFSGRLGAHIEDFSAEALRTRQLGLCLLKVVGWSYAQLNDNVRA